MLSHIFLHEFSILRPVILIKRDKFDRWLTNIENAAMTTAYRSDVAHSVSQRYDAHKFYDLASCYYGEMLVNLEQIANGN